MASEYRWPSLDNNINNSLQHRLVVDAAAAVTAAATIAWIITATDRSVVKNVSTRRPLVRTLTKHLLSTFTSPRRFFSNRAVYVVWTLYAATYFIANTSDTLIERYLDPDKTPTGTLVSFAAFDINTPLSVWKDVRFSQFFGNRLEAAPKSTRV
ncbi:putative Mitochondrial fission process protein 1 [Seiridium cardinale]